MLDALYWAAAVMALTGVRKGNWSALPLLASAAFCAFVRWQDIAFNLVLWLLVDGLVLFAITTPLWPPVRARAWRGLWHAYRAELAILVLFVPALAAYAMPAHLAHVVSTAAGTVQLLLTFPYRRFADRWWRTLHQHHDWTHFDLREAIA